MPARFAYGCRNYPLASTGYCHEGTEDAGPITASIRKFDGCIIQYRVPRPLQPGWKKGGASVRNGPVSVCIPTGPCPMNSDGSPARGGLPVSLMGSGGRYKIWPLTWVSRSSKFAMSRVITIKAGEATYTGTHLLRPPCRSTNVSMDSSGNGNREGRSSRVTPVAHGVDAAWPGRSGLNREGLTRQERSRSHSPLPLV